MLEFIKKNNKQKCFVLVSSMPAKVVLLIAFCLAYTSIFSQLKLPEFFSDNMILQQNAKVTIWGKDYPNTYITISGSWGNVVTTTSNQNGQWRIKIKTPKAQGFQTLTISGSSSKTINNVLLGEVWLCSGQSNMEMPMKGYPKQPIHNGQDAIANSANTNIRFFIAPRTVSLTPVDTVNGNWLIADSNNTKKFSATAYYFARKLQKELGVPIGVLQTAWGNSNIESWMDEESLKAYPSKIIPTKIPEKTPQLNPTLMYNTMIHPFVGYTIKGMLWYQGESNKDNYQEYSSLMKTFIHSCRSKWQQGNFPFYFVQIAPHDYGQNVAQLREAQLKAFQTIKNTGMVCTMDIGEPRNIHPGQKDSVGKRLAYWALNKDYGKKDIAFCGPIYKKMKIVDSSRIEISFDYVYNGLTTNGKPLTNFEIAGSDKIFYPAEAIISTKKNNAIIVWSSKVAKPVSVRYGYKSWLIGELFNSAGIAASSFRTDNW